MYFFDKAIQSFTVDDINMCIKISKDHLGKIKDAEMKKQMEDY